MSRDFQLSAINMLDKEPETYVEWLFIMQHFGIPTRLIDWSESYLSALYFAVEEFEECDNHPSVWILDPRSLNKAILKTQKTIPTHVNNTIVRDYELYDSPNNINRDIKAEYPIALRAIKSNPRIFTQKGMFTIHGFDKSPLNELVNNPKVGSFKIEQLIIDKNYKKKIFRELYKAGISQRNIYPDLTGLAKEIKTRYQESYLRR